MQFPHALRQLHSSFKCKVVEHSSVRLIEEASSRDIFKLVKKKFLATCKCQDISVTTQYNANKSTPGGADACPAYFDTKFVEIGLKNISHF